MFKNRMFFSYSNIDRWWRKNTNGFGIDLNRNFDDHWGGNNIKLKLLLPLLGTTTTTTTTTTTRYYYHY